MKEKMENKDNRPVFQGWECPRCNTMHSPFTSKCTCRPPQKTNISSMSDVDKQDYPKYCSGRLDSNPLSETFGKWIED